MPATLPQISALPLHHLAINPHRPLSALLQGQCGTLIIPPVAHAHATLLTALRLRQGVPPLLPTKVPAPLAHISALPLRRGRPRLQTSEINPTPRI